MAPNKWSKFFSENYTLIKNELKENNPGTHITRKDVFDVLKVRYRVIFPIPLIPYKEYKKTNIELIKDQNPNLSRKDINKAIRSQWQTSGVIRSSPLSGPMDYIEPTPSSGQINEVIKLGDYKLIVNGRKINYNVEVKDRFHNFERRFIYFSTDGLDLSIEEYYKVFTVLRPSEQTYLVVREINNIRNHEIEFKPVDINDYDTFIKFYDSVRGGGWSSGSDPIDEAGIDTSFMGLMWFIAIGIEGEDKGNVSSAFLNDFTVDYGGLCLYNSICHFFEDKSKITDVLNITCKTIDNDYLCKLAISKDTKTLPDGCGRLYLEGNIKIDLQIGDIPGFNDTDVVEKINDLTNDRKSYFTEIVKRITPKLLRLSYDDDIIDSENRIFNYKNHFQPFNGFKEDYYYICPKLSIYSPKSRTRLITREKCIKERVFKGYGIDTKLASFDFETVYNPDGNLITYSAFLTVSYNDIEVKHFEKFYYGIDKDIIKDMLNDLIEMSQNNLLIFMGFNISRFDSILLIPKLLEMNLLDNIFYSNNSVLSMKINGRHQSFDLSRFLSGSLKDNCINFNIKGKEEIGEGGHEEIQRHYNKYGELDSYFHDMEICEGGNIECDCPKFKQLKKYNERDTTAVIDLYKILDKTFKDAKFLESNENLFDFKTIGSLAYKNFKKCLKKKDIVLPNMDKNLYGKMRDSLFAGRTQVYNDGKPLYIDKEEIKILDVKSLYPWAYLYNNFPCGKRIRLSFKDCNKMGLIGWYWCKFDQENLKVNILPKRGETLNWNYKGEQTLFLNTVDINNLIKHGCRCEIIEYTTIYKNKKQKSILYDDISKILTGEYKKNYEDVRKSKLDSVMKKKAYDHIKHDYYTNLSDIEKMKYDNFVFSKVVNGFELFEPFADMKKIKDGEDLKPKSEKNESLRTLAKLCLNCVSGKVIERIHYNETILVKSKADYKKIEKKFLDGVIGEFHPSAIFNKVAGILKIDKDVESAFKSQNKKPFYIGILIYSYARRLMYDSILSKYKTYYQDTDSAFLPISEFNKIMEIEPDIIGPNFGQFEDEKPTTKLMRSVFLSPKNYFVLDENKKLIKKGFKGVRIDRDKYLGKLTEWEFNDIKAMSLLELNNLYETGETVAKKIDEFVKDMRQDSYTYVLCSSLNKCFRTVNKSNKHAGGIYQQYMIKKITC